MNEEEKTETDQLQEIAEQPEAPAEKIVEPPVRETFPVPTLASTKTEEPATETKPGLWAWFKKTWLAQYHEKMARNGLTIPLSTWFALAFLGSTAIAILGYLVFQLIEIDNSVFLSGILFFVGIDLTIGYPITLESKRLEEIEKALPDALKQIADTLQAGGTYEFALRELLSSNFGPLNAEIEKVLRKLDEGENMENSLRTIITDNDSKLIQRSITIIIDALKTGAALSEVLDQVSDDIRELRRIKQERRSRTIMGVMLMVAAGAIVAPGLFGINSSILEFMIKTVVSTNVGTPEIVANALSTQAFISFLLVFYIFIELIATSLMLALMRDGKASKSIIYAPMLLLIGYTAYYGTRLFAVNTILKAT